MVQYVIPLLILAGPALAGNCSSIKDGDDQAFCRALTERRESTCSSIRDNDKRQMCRALIK